MGKGGRMTLTQRDQKMSQGAELFAKGLSIPNISEILGVGLKTIYKWRDVDDWEKKKEVNSIRPSEIKKMILEYVVALKKGEKPPYKADDLSKIAAAFDRLDDNRKKAVYTMESFNDFSGSMMESAAKATGKKRDKILKLLKDIRPHLDGHITKLLAND